MKKAVCLQIHTEEIQKKAEKNLVKLICDTFQVRICLRLLRRNQNNVTHVKMASSNYFYFDRKNFHF